MPITYRQHQDTRDGKIYNCVLMPDGKWWSAENLAWDGAGVYYNNDPANGQIYGKLYGWDAAQVSCPPGAHLASDAEWGVLKGIIPSPDGVKLKANSTLWTPNTGTDNYGFAIVPSGYYSGLNYTNINIYCGLWTATGSGADGKYYAVNANNTSLFEGYIGKEIQLSVRFIVDVFNEPIPPTKIKGAFSGSGVKAYFTNHNTATLELPISAQTTTELTIDKDFISFWGPFLGNVRILVVDGEYISDWKDWNFNA